MTWAGATDVGRIRKVNEDAWFAAPGVWVVADGMGGHAAGDVASALTIDTLASLAVDHPITMPTVAAAIGEANRRVWQHAVDTGVDGMGCTLAGAAQVDIGGRSSLLVFHAGDARCYLADPSGWRPVTKDHSHVQELIDEGVISAQQAITHPDRNVVTRAIGIEPMVSPEFLVLAVDAPCRLVVCSDGVHGEIAADELEMIATTDPDAAATATAVLRHVLAGRAADNATVIVVDLEPLGGELDLVDAEVTGPRAPRLGDDLETTPRRLLPPPTTPPVTDVVADLILGVPAVVRTHADFVPGPTADENPVDDVIDEVPK